MRPMKTQKNQVNGITHHLLGPNAYKCGNRIALLIASWGTFHLTRFLYNILKEDNVLCGINGGEETKWKQAWHFFLVSMPGSGVRQLPGSMRKWLPLTRCSLTVVDRTIYEEIRK